MLRGEQGIALRGHREITLVGQMKSLRQRRKVISSRCRFAENLKNLAISPMQIWYSGKPESYKLTNCKIELMCSTVSVNGHWRMANISVDRLNAEGSRDSGSWLIRGNSSCYFL